jgi:ribonuclease-3
VSPTLEELEQRLGIEFCDRELLQRALTHPSYSLENGGSDYERLEFLGDSVLAWVVAAHLFAAFPDLDEGLLTRMKVALTSGRTLATVARDIELGDWMRFGKGAIREAGRASVLENCFEALVGAVYLDAGAPAAWDFTLRWLGDRIDRDTLIGTVSDPKSRLQEFTQRNGLGLPSYEIVEVSGPAHDPSFTARVTVRGEMRGEGSGTSKQLAQQSAAIAALERLGAS